MTFVNDDVLSQQIQQAPPKDREHDANSSLLLEVDFKLLMAGFGWWIDTTRLHQDPLHAAHCLDNAIASTSSVLRMSAAKLRFDNDAAALAKTTPLHLERRSPHTPARGWVRKTISPLEQPTTRTS